MYSPERDEWRASEIGGTPPAARYYHSAHTFKRGAYVVMFGGLSSDGNLYVDRQIDDSLYVLDVENMHWMRPIIGGPQPGRRLCFAHCGYSSYNDESDVQEDSVVIFGGVGPDLEFCEPEVFRIMDGEYWKEVNAGQIEKETGAEELVKVEGQILDQAQEIEEIEESIAKAKEASVEADEEIVKLESRLNKAQTCVETVSGEIITKISNVEAEGD